MEVVYERCCGLDIHKASNTACVMVGRKKIIHKFGTMTDDLLEMTTFLKEQNVQMTAMESAGSFWKPVFNILEVEEISAILVNAAHIKAVPGRKSSEWIADLLRHGLLIASFVKPRDQRELCELVRYRGSLIANGSQEVDQLGAVFHCSTT
jgi:hypothetical protein